MAPAFLTASEIGAYAFCHQAWHLQRRRAVRSRFAAQRLTAGSVTNRRIGKRTDALRTTEAMRGLLFWLIVVLFVLIAMKVTVVGSP